MRQPWIKNPWFDGLYILAPPFAALMAVLILPDRFKTTDEMPVVGWVALVLLVDVAHVYSTLFRTYFNNVRFRQQRVLFLLVPIACYIVGVSLHSFNHLLFWRCLAYLAVFHFIRQQYGFMRIYSRSESSPAWVVGLDTIVIYASTIYPIAWWHLTPGRHFNWFVDGDFIQGEFASLKSIATGLYGVFLLLYVSKEIWFYVHTRWINWPRNLLIIGTVVSWYFGIVYFNGDLAFTMLNVISHGIPYLALIWASNQSETEVGKTSGNSALLAMASRSWIIFIGMLVLLAYLEEGLWDGFVWREHATVFGWFQALPALTNELSLALLVPLLALPQMTHYVLDGFIWRRNHTS
jgi:hypothetical protein